MCDAVDLRELLQSWPYDPEDNLRVARGADGREILQVRLPCGLEQFEMEGRPDGLPPCEMESWLDYQEDRFQQAQARGEAADFELTEAECAQLFEEGTLYYFRYLRLFELKDWARTARDTQRNLRLFDFVSWHATRPEDRQHLEQWRPYVLRIHATAAAMFEVDRGELDQALALLEAFVEKIEALEELKVQTFQFERRRSLAVLRELADQIRQARPLSEQERLEQELRRAVANEEFEQAARLRDRLRGLRGP